MAKQVYVEIKKNDFARLKKATPEAVNKALRAAAQEGVNIARQEMLDSPANGRLYMRGGKAHRASSPGQSPRPDTGTLLNSLRWEEASKVVMLIIAAAEYAYDLEFGNGKIAARPFFGPMARQLENEVLPKAFDKFLEKA
jgi:hypothetical protein